MQSATPPAATSLHLPVRQDWLDRRREEIIDPDLPIVDPHHHLVDRPETGRYLLPDLLADTGSGHNITATVYLEWLSMYRAAGPAELRPVGEVEFANGVAAVAASGTHGKTQRRVAAELGGAGGGVAALYRDLHRRLWPAARDVREQLSGRQRQLRLRGIVERLQAHRHQLFRRRAGGTVCRHRDKILPVEVNLAPRCKSRRI
jgi:hypothetical protein